MPISIAELQTASYRNPPQSIAKSLNQAQARAKQTAFLCHSHLDNQLAKGLQVLLAEQGWDIYIDWEDAAMPPKPDRTTANRIKEKIGQLDWFLFLATPNSTSSKWCPWEIGIADVCKTNQKIIIIPTKDNSGSWHGNEYLQLYNQITYANDGHLAKFPAGSLSGGTYLRSLR